MVSDVKGQSSCTRSTASLQISQSFKKIADLEISCEYIYPVSYSPAYDTVLILYPKS